MIRLVKTLAFLVVTATIVGQNLISSPDIVIGEIIVQFQNHVEGKVFLNNLKSESLTFSNLKIKEQISKKWNIFLLQYDDARMDKYSIMDELQNQPEIKRVEFNYMLEFRDSVPNDPLFDTQWDMQIIEAPFVWGVNPGGETINGDEIVVAVLDKGFELDHPDLVDQIWKNPNEIPENGFDDDNNGKTDDSHGWNFIHDLPNHPVERHGTNVMGIVGAKGNNNIGLAGVNWNVKLMPLAAANSGQLFAAYDYVFDIRKKYNDTNGAQGGFVVATNLSAGFSRVHCSENPIWDSIFEDLGAIGVLNVGATDNANYDVDIEGDIPSSCESEFLITVTNTDIDDEKVESAAFGLNSIDLGAPGKATTTTTLFAQFREDFGGTSSASPHVAGAVALLYAMPCNDLANLALADPPAAARLVRDAIFEGVDPLPTLNGITVTGGRLNLKKAMQFLHGFCIANELRNERDNYAFQDIYLKSQDLLNIYPNPTQDILKIDYSSPEFGQMEINIFNTLGQLLYKEVVTVTPFVPQTIIVDDVRDWAAGTYFVNVVNDDEKITEKFIKGRF